MYDSVMNVRPQCPRYILTLWPSLGPFLNTLAGILTSQSVEEVILLPQNILFQISVPVSLSMGSQWPCVFGLPWDAISTLPVFPFCRPGGGRVRGSSVSFPGVSMSAIYRLKTSSGGTLMSSCSAVKLQGEIYGKVNQLIPHCQFCPGLLWEIRQFKSKAYPGPLHSSECSSLFSNVLPPYSKHIVPFPQWSTSFWVSCPLGNPMLLPKKGAFSFFWFCFVFFPLLNTLKATSTH